MFENASWNYGNTWAGTRFYSQQQAEKRQKDNNRMVTDQTTEPEENEYLLIESHFFISTEPISSLDVLCKTSLRIELIVIQKTF